MCSQTATAIGMVSSLIFIVAFITIVPIASAQLVPECIKYELHERATAKPSQVQLLSENCLSSNGFLESYSRIAFKSRPGPTAIWNTTFECCSNRTCQNDFDCPFNFLCGTERRCTVAGCDLTDDVDLIMTEGQDCVIDEDCTFFVPNDAAQWKCIAAPGCDGLDGSNCVSDKCKRCSKAKPSRVVPFAPEELLSTTVPPFRPLVFFERNFTADNSTAHANPISSTTTEAPVTRSETPPSIENITAPVINDRAPPASGDDNLTTAITSDGGGSENEFELSNNSIPDTALGRLLASLLEDLVESNTTEVTTTIPLDPELLSTATTLSEEGSNLILDVNGTTVTVEELDDPTSTTTERSANETLAADADNEENSTGSSADPISAGGNSTADQPETTTSYAANDLYVAEPTEPDFTIDSGTLFLRSNGPSSEANETDLAHIEDN